jgi:hypothetical protein
VAALDLAAVMDGIGTAVTASGLARNVYSYPVNAVVTPCVLVDYPTAIDLSSTMQRGTDHVSLPVLYLVDKNYTRESRDALSAVIAGGTDLVAAIEGAHAWGDAAVTDAAVTSVMVGEIAYLGLKLTVDVQT